MNACFAIPIKAVLLLSSSNSKGKITGYYKAIGLDPNVVNHGKTKKVFLKELGKCPKQMQPFANAKGWGAGCVANPRFGKLCSFDIYARNRKHLDIHKASNE